MTQCTARKKRNDHNLQKRQQQQISDNLIAADNTSDQKQNNIDITQFQPIQCLWRKLMNKLLARHREGCPSHGKGAHLVFKTKDTALYLRCTECECAPLGCLFIPKDSPLFGKRYPPIQATQPSNSDLKHQKKEDTPPFQPHMTLQEVFKLKVLDKIDHRDQVGRFVLATVIKKQGTNLKIHYNGWSREWDTWSDYSREIHRFAVAKSISKRRAHRFEHLKKGDYVDINPSQLHRGWKCGEILRLDQASGQVQVAYEAMDKKRYRYWAHLDNKAEIAAFTSKSGTVQRTQLHIATVNAASINQKRLHSKLTGSFKSEPHKKRRKLETQSEDRIQEYSDLVARISPAPIQWKIPSIVDDASDSNSNLQRCSFRIRLKIHRHPLKEALLQIGARNFTVNDVWNTLMEMQSAAENCDDDYDVVIEQGETARHWLKEELMVIPGVYRVHRSGNNGEIYEFKSTHAPSASLKNKIIENLLTKHAKIQSLLQSLCDKEIDELDGDATILQIQNHYDDIMQLIEQGKEGYNNQKRSRSELENSKNSETQTQRRKTEIQRMSSEPDNTTNSNNTRECGRFQIRIQTQDQLIKDALLHIGPRNFSIDEIHDILTKQNWKLIVLLRGENPWN